MNCHLYKKFTNKSIKVSDLKNCAFFLQIDPVYSECCFGEITRLVAYAGILSIMGNGNTRYKQSMIYFKRVAM